MTINSDRSSRSKILLLESAPESLSVVGTQWTDADVLVQGLHEAQGITDLISREKVGVEQLEPFLEALPSKLDWVIEYVTPQRLEAFRQKAVDCSAAVIGEYLNEDS